MSELKRCPFCGCELIKLNLEPEIAFLHDNKECFLGLFAIHDYETEKIKTWNTRKPMDKIVERLEDNKMWSELLIYSLTHREREIIKKAIEIVKEEI